jgi:integrase
MSSYHQSHPRKEGPCERCRRPLKPGASRFNFPDGSICISCYTRCRALETHGTCSGCGTDRLVPGLTPAGEPLCTSCSRLDDFTCERCGKEGRRYLRGICGNCVLTDRLAALLDDGTGQPRTDLVPLLDGVGRMQRPWVGITWVGTDDIQRILPALAHGDVPLTHEGLDQLGAPRTLAFLRDLLMEHGVLPKRDRHLLMFEAWLARRLQTIDEPARALLDQYATWDILRKLRRSAARQPLRPTQTKTHRTKIVQAAAFLAWLDDRGRPLDACTQAYLDAWHAEHRTTRRPAQQFLRWAIKAGHMPKLIIPNISTSNPAPISQRRRIELIRRFLTDETIPLIDRVTATLILLYAQPLTRIVQLTLDEITTDGGTVFLRLGDPPTPVPEPFATLIRDYVAARPNTLTATNPASRWLFPGRRAGQPLHPDTISGRLGAHGLHRTNARTAALRHLVLQAPAPVIAGMLGFNNETTHRHAAAAGTPWSHYAPGDHTQ